MLLIQKNMRSTFGIADHAQLVRLSVKILCRDGEPELRASGGPDIGRILRQHTGNLEASDMQGNDLGPVGSLTHHPACHTAALRDVTLSVQPLTGSNHCVRDRQLSFENRRLRPVAQQPQLQRNAGPESCRNQGLQKNRARGIFLWLQPDLYDRVPINDDRGIDCFVRRLRGKRPTLQNI